MNNNVLICSTVILGGVCMTCCFIGHRKIKHKKELVSRLRDNICYLLEQGVATFLFGDHSEFNTLCYEVVSELREVYPKIRRMRAVAMRRLHLKHLSLPITTQALCS
jgi:hypothetical protein